MLVANGRGCLATSKKPYIGWNICVLRDEFDSEDKYLNSKYSPQLEQHVVKLTGATEGKLYLKDAVPKLPAWAKLFKGKIIPELKSKSSSISAVLVVEGSTKRFALLFGHGRALLAPDSWEQEFGLKIVLNVVDEKSIREIEMSAFDALLQNKVAQSVRDADIEEFQLNVDHDVIRSIRGTPSSAKFGRQIAGRDTLSISVQNSLEELPELLESVYSASLENAYQDKFSWVGRMTEVRTKAVRITLDDALVAKLKGKDVARAWLSAPEYSKWKAGCSFNITHVKEGLPDIHLGKFLDSLESKGKLQEVNIAALKRWAVEIVDENGFEQDAWTFYRCLYAELELDGSTYLLNNGSWYLIQADYLKAVNDDYAAFPILEGSLPNFDDACEGDYNSRICTEDASYALMDKKTIESKARALTKIEFCDLYHNDRKIIHVKRFSGSSELSHLFAQAVVPAELFLYDSEFRVEVNKKLPASHALNDPSQKPNPSDYEVVYGIVSRSSHELTLPFFSKVVLRNSSRRLKELGYKVKLCKIVNNGA